MKICHNKEYKEANKKINKVYKKLMKMLDKVGKQKLRKSERAWIKYRDANSEFKADMARGGTMEGLLYTNSEIYMIRERTKELESIVKELEYYK